MGIAERLTLGSLATSAGGAGRLSVLLRGTRACAGTSSTLVAGAAGTLDLVLGGGLLASAVKSGLLAAGAGSFLCADAAAFTAAAGGGNSSGRSRHCSGGFGFVGCLER